jgi:hypothetical protein
MTTNYFKQETVTPPAQITLGAHKRQTLDSVVYSYDKNVSKLIIPVALPKGVELDFEDFEDVEAIKVLLTVTQDGETKKIEDTATIEASHRRRISYILTDRLKGYAGKVTMNVYLDLKNGQQIDLAEYGFTMVRSAIDQDIPEIEDFYFKSLDDVITELRQKADAIIKDITVDLSELTGSVNAVGDKVDQLGDKADEISEQLAKSDFRRIILGREMTIDGNANFTGKVKGSVAENPHSAYFSQTADVPNPPINTGEISTANYTNIATNDGKLIAPSVNVATRRMSLVAQFDIVSDIDRNNPGLFDYFGATTSSDRLALVRKLVNGTIRPVAYAYGGGASTTTPGTSRSQINMQIHSGKTWEGGAINTTSKIAMLEYNNQTGQRVQDDGCVYIVLYAPPSDGVVPSVINIDQVYLEYQINFKTSDVFALKSVAQMSKITKDNGDALIDVKDNETMIDRIINNGAGLATGSAGKLVSDSPSNSSLTRFVSIMVGATGGSVFANDAGNNFYTRVISSSKWYGEWERHVTAKEFNDLAAKVAAIESKVK